MPASSSDASRSLPAGPTNGLPSISSWFPGCSPMKRISERFDPSPKTVCVRFSKGRSSGSSEPLPPIPLEICVILRLDLKGVCRRARNLPGKSQKRRCRQIDCRFIRRIIFYIVYILRIWPVEFLKWILTARRTTHCSPRHTGLKFSNGSFHDCAGQNRFPSVVRPS